jgi:PHP family Zn ribbon phosphoesterase
MRAGKIHVTPGFDGEYGKIKLFEKPEQKVVRGQGLLF